MSKLYNKTDFGLFRKNKQMRYTQDNSAILLSFSQWHRFSLKILFLSLSQINIILAVERRINVSRINIFVSGLLSGHFELIHNCNIISKEHCCLLLSFTACCSKWRFTFSLNAVLVGPVRLSDCFLGIISYVFLKFWHGATTSHIIYWDNHFLQKISPPPLLRSMLMSLQNTLRPCFEQITDPQHWYRGGEEGS